MKYFLKNKLSIITLLLMISSLITNLSFKTNALDTTNCIEAKNDLLINKFAENGEFISSESTVNLSYTEKYQSNIRYGNGFITDTELQYNDYVTLLFKNAGTYKDQPIDIKVKVHSFEQKQDYVIYVPESFGKNKMFFSKRLYLGYWFSVNQFVEERTVFKSGTTERIVIDQNTAFMTTNSLNQAEYTKPYNNLDFVAMGENIILTNIGNESNVYYGENNNFGDFIGSDTFHKNSVQFKVLNSSIKFVVGSINDGQSWNAPSSATLVNTCAEPPTKKVDKSLVIDQKNEEINYTITQNIQQLGTEITKFYTKFELIDNLDKNLELVSYQILNQDNKDISTYYNFKHDLTSNQLKITAKADALKNESFYDNDLVVKIKTKLKTQLEANYIIKNKASVNIDNKIKNSNEVTTSLASPKVVSKKELSPNQKLPVEKGDTVQYLITLENIGLGISYDNVITDKIDSRYDFVKTDKVSQFKNGELIWNVGNLKGGEKQTLLLTLKVNQTADANDLIPNFITIKNGDLVKPDTPLNPKNVPVLEKPTETVSDQNENKVLKNLIESSDKSFVYHTSQLIPTESIQNVILKNTIDPNFDIQKITITDDQKNDITNDYDITTNSNQVIATSKNLIATLGKRINLNIELKLKQDVDLNSYLSQNKNQYEFKNQSQVLVNHITNQTNEVNTILILPIEEYIADIKYETLVYKNQLENYEIENFDYVIFDTLIDYHDTFKNYQFKNKINDSLKINSIKIIDNNNIDLTDIFVIENKDNLITATNDPINFYKTKNIDYKELKFIINVSIKDLTNFEKISENQYKFKNYSTITVNDTQKTSNQVTTQFQVAEKEIFEDTGTNEKIITLTSLLLFFIIILTLTIKYLKIRRTT